MRVIFRVDRISNRAIWRENAHARRHLHAFEYPFGSDYGVVNKRQMVLADEYEFECNQNNRSDHKRNRARAEYFCKGLEKHGHGTLPQFAYPVK